VPHQAVRCPERIDRRSPDPNIRDRYDCVGDVRGRGLLVGVEIVADKKSEKPSPEVGAATTRRCMELGLSMLDEAIAGVAG